MNIETTAGRAPYRSPPPAFDSRWKVQCRATRALLWATRLAALLLIVCLAVIAHPAQAQEQAPDQPATQQQQDDFDFFSDEPIAEEELVEVPPAPSPWVSIGAPIGLFAFFVGLVWLFHALVPFEQGTVELNLRQFPTGVRRGLAMAVLLYAIAFVFGAAEIWYQLGLYGSTEAYFEQMSLGKLIAFTHAHLFGFTTSFLIIGIPFSMQFNHLWPYQWFFPLGLAASVTDVMSWWGIKYLTPNIEVVTVFCGIVFSVTYLYMLIGLTRVLWFRETTWFSDKARAGKESGARG